MEIVVTPLHRKKNIYELKEAASVLLSLFKRLPWRGDFFRYDSHNEEYCALSLTGVLNFHISKTFVTFKFV